MLAVVPGAIPVIPPASVHGGGPLGGDSPGAGDAVSIPRIVSTVIPPVNLTIVASCACGPSFLTVREASPAGRSVDAAVPVTSSGATIPFARCGVPSGDEMKQRNA